MYSKQSALILADHILVSTSFAARSIVTKLTVRALIAVLRG